MLRGRRIFRVMATGADATPELSIAMQAGE
jgi:hypothetical protein